MPKIPFRIFLNRGMIIEHDIVGTSYHLFFKGKFIFSDLETFSRITTFIKENKFNEVVIDMADLDFIDSAAIGMLLILAETLKEGNIKFKIKNYHNQVERVFKVVKITDLLFKEPK